MTKEDPSREAAGYAATRVYLVVPYVERDMAKALGARWDARQRCWYVAASVNLAPFERWRLQQGTVIPLSAAGVRSEQQRVHTTSADARGARAGGCSCGTSTEWIQRRPCAHTGVRLSSQLWAKQSEKASRALHLRCRDRAHPGGGLDLNALAGDDRDQALAKVDACCDLSRGATLPNTRSQDACRPDSLAAYQGATLLAVTA